jgi:TRAP-type C4-dicarboxylate transport system permease large subunit
MLKIIFLFLMAGGIPVAVAMAGSALLYIWWTGNLPPFVVIHRMVSGIDSFPLLAVPFFILAGNLMNNAGITNRIYNYALALVGWLKGGLGHVNVVGSVVFAGMSGTAIADAAGLGTIEIKAMTDHGYSKEFAVGVTAASATLGPIIPPSLPFVIYGMMANVSVGALFLAGILPGVLMAVLMMLTVAYFAHKNGWGGDIKFEWPRVIKALAETAVVILWPVAVWLLIAKAGLPPQITVVAALVVLFAMDKYFNFQAALPIMTPVLLIGGMTTGIFTPTEGAIAACLWAMVLGFAWYRTLNWKMFVKICAGHGGDDGHGAVHRGSGQHFWLDADGHRRYLGHRAMGARLHQGALGVPAAGQPADAVCGLLPGADCRDHDSCAHPGADLPATGH